MFYKGVVFAEQPDKFLFGFVPSLPLYKVCVIVLVRVATSAPDEREREHNTQQSTYCADKALTPYKSRGGGGGVLFANSSIFIVPP